jgi:pimeloyl-ACP methyl ester carboxylesterase
MKSSIVYFFILSCLISCNTEDKKSIVEKGFAQVNGTKLYYELAGTGEPLVLVHGNFGDRRHWDFQFSSLSKNYKVIRYDVRGYGKSALPKSDEPYNDYNDLKSLLDFLEIDIAHICGVSLGSGIAVDFAIAYPEMSKSLIPSGPWANGFGLNEYKTQNSDSLSSIFSKSIEIVINDGPKESTDYVWTGNPLFIVKSTAALDSILKIGYEYSWWGFINKNKRKSLSPAAISRLNDIKVPTLIITAEYDLEACKEVAEIMENRIPGASKISINNAGHMMNMDKPEEFNRIISEFINENK